MSIANDLLHQVLALPQQERAAMAHQILLSLELDDFDEDAEAAWAAEIEARLDSIERGDFVAYDAREALEDIRKQLPRRSTS
ncbi:MAG TPA: addiction module protein [Pirellulales bacterium]|nr:addiction module protein [Pirellulales bacterium]